MLQEITNTFFIGNNNISFSYVKASNLFYLQLIVLVIVAFHRETESCKFQITSLINISLCLIIFEV